MVPVARAGRAPERAPEHVVAQEEVEQRPQRRIVHLPGQVLEEAVQLVEVAVRHGQELRRIGVAGVGAAHRAELGLELVPEALDPARHLHQVALLELPGDEVGVAEDAGRQRAGAIAQLEREVGRARAGGQPILA